MCADGRGGAWITYQIVGFGSTEAGVDDGRRRTTLLSKQAARSDAWNNQCPRDIF